MKGDKQQGYIDDPATECDTFTRYLCGLPADEYIRRKYVDAQLYLTPMADEHPVDRALLEAGRRGGGHLSSADIYAKFFRPRTPLRQKLIIVLAIIENAPSTHRYLNSAAGGGFILSVFRILGLLAGTAVGLIIGVLRFGPRQFASQRVASVRIEAADAP